jgi:type II secretory pathway pseudopilin PulG
MTDRTTKALLLGILLAVVLHGLASARATSRQQWASSTLERIEIYLRQSSTDAIAMKALLNQIEINTCAQTYKTQNVNATAAEVAARCPSRLGSAWTTEASWRVVADR